MHRRHYRKGGIEASHVVNIKRADFIGHGLGRAGLIHNARHALNDVVVSRAMPDRAVLSIGRDRTVNEAGIEVADIVVANAQRRGRTGLKIFDKDISAGDQLFQNLRALRGFEVEGNRFFVGVLGQKTRSHLCLGELGVPPASSRPIANTWKFDFNHLGSEEAKLVGTVRPGEDLGDINHTATGQGSKHGGCRLSFPFNLVR